MKDHTRQISALREGIRNTERRIREMEKEIKDLQESIVGREKYIKQLKAEDEARK